MQKVAFLGLGAIGRPMARHLARDPFTLTVWNRTVQRAASFATETGAHVAATPADAARGADVLITCLSTSGDVESILDGNDGILAGIGRGAVFVDCTSGDPATSRKIAARMEEAGVEFIDAPVSGGTTGAEQGTLTVMCGGDVAVMEKVRPVLDAFAGKIVHCGPVGAGDALKAVNNALLAINIWAAAEGLAALVKTGVPAAVALDVINTSSGRSNATENLFPQRVLTRAFPRTFRAALLDKDVGIAAELTREQKVTAPIIQIASELFHSARAVLGEDADHVEVVKLIEEWAGVEIA